MGAQVHQFKSQASPLSHFLSKQLLSIMVKTVKTKNVSCKWCDQGECWSHGQIEKPKAVKQQGGKGGSKGKGNSKGKGQWVQVGGGGGGGNNGALVAALVQALA